MALVMLVEELCFSRITSGTAFVTSHFCFVAFFCVYISPLPPSIPRLCRVRVVFWRKYWIREKKKKEREKWRRGRNIDSFWERVRRQRLSNNHKPTGLKIDGRMNKRMCSSHVSSSLSQTEVTPSLPPHPPLTLFFHWGHHFFIVTGDTNRNRTGVYGKPGLKRAFSFLFKETHTHIALPKKKWPPGVNWANKSEGNHHDYCNGYVLAAGL